MNRLKIITIAALIMPAMFSAVLYTSCNKNACVGVTCFNNAACNNGKCICLTGYSGLQCDSRNTTSITYQNNTPSFIEITTPSSGSFDIGPGEIDSIQGPYGSNIAATAVTTSFSSPLSGETVTWNFNDTFPESGSLIVPINIPANYFFLNVVNVNSNDSSYYIDKIVVNNGLSTQVTLTGIEGINSFSGIVPIGYFYASATSNVYLYATYIPYTWPAVPVTLPDTINQSFTATAYYCNSV